MIVSKVIELDRLQTEAAAAGMTFPRGLGLNGNVLHTYDAVGNQIDVPAGMQAVVNAHDGTATRTANETQRQNAVTAYNAIINAPNSTPITAGALKPILRYLVRILRAETPEL